MVKLNCDMGESFGIYTLGMDEKIMPYIDMANLACGFHASDPVTMHRSIKLAKEHGVEIGCHPSYPDLVGFGRREMNCSTEEVIAFTIYQLGALDGLCKSHNTKLTYLKPHGSLYNAMRDEQIFIAIAKAISKYDNSIKLMILSSSKNNTYLKLAQKYKISLLYELFADRAYSDEGFLVPRTQKGAVLNYQEVIDRAKLLVDKGVVKTINNQKLKLKADTLCVHGDNEEAYQNVKKLSILLK
jgi:UPF0271 protein